MCATVICFLRFIAKSTLQKQVKRQTVFVLAFLFLFPFEQ